MYMKTFAERNQNVKEMLSDPDLTLTLKESYRFLYHWYRYELALRQRGLAQRKLTKYTDLLERDRQIFALRRDMTDL